MHLFVVPYVLRIETGRPLEDSNFEIMKRETPMFVKTEFSSGDFLSHIIFIPVSPVIYFVILSLIQNLQIHDAYKLQRLLLFTTIYLT
jgi:hypothetical protein